MCQRINAKTDCRTPAKTTRNVSIYNLPGGLSSQSFSSIEPRPLRIRRAHFPRVLGVQRVSIALRHTVDLVASHLSVVGVIRLAPRLGVLSAMRAVNDAPESPDPGIEEVAWHVGPVGLWGRAVVGGRGGAFGGAERRVQSAAGLEAHADVGGAVGGDDGAGQGGWAVKSGLCGREFVVAVRPGDHDVE